MVSTSIQTVARVAPTHLAPSLQFWLFRPRTILSNNAIYPIPQVVQLILLGRRLQYLNVLRKMRKLEIFSLFSQKTVGRVT